MSGKIRILSILLVVQLALVLAVWWRTLAPAGDAGAQQLLEFDPAQVSAITITAGNDSVALKREQDHWLLEGTGGLHADGARVKELLDKLHSLQAAWPVANSVASAARFEVGDDNAQRRIQLTTGESSTTLLLGTSPGVRKVHVRVAGQEATYPVDLAHYQAPARAVEWLDGNLLSYGGDVQSVTAGDFGLKREGEVWTVAGLDAAQLDPEAIEAWLDNLKALRVLDIAAGDAVAALASVEPARTLDIQGSGGDASYRFFRHDGNVYVQRTGVDGTFSVAAYLADPLVDVAAQRFLRAPEQPGSGGDGARPADGETSDSEPAEEESAGAEPVVGEPLDPEPAVGEPAVGEPAVGEPAVPSTE